MRLRPRLAFPEKITFSARISPWLAGGSGSPRWREVDGGKNPYQRLQEKLAAMPALEFGTMTAREFFLYQSQLMQDGAKYRKIARFGLG